MPKPFTPPPIDEDLLTIEQLASLLDTTPNSIYVQRNRGLPPGSLGVVFRNRLWWRARDVQRWLDESLAASFDEAWEKRNQRKPEPIVTEARRLADARRAGDVE